MERLQKELVKHGSTHIMDNSKNTLINHGSSFPCGGQQWINTACWVQHFYFEPQLALPRRDHPPLIQNKKCNNLFIKLSYPRMLTKPSNPIPRYKQNVNTMLVVMYEA